MSVGAIGAYVVAPLFLKNDQRGYFETSLITTPLITAGAMVAPQFFSIARAEYARAKNFGQMAAQRMANKSAISYQDIVNYTKAYGDKSMSLQQYEALLGNYYAGAGRNGLGLSILPQQKSPCARASRRSSPAAAEWLAAALSPSTPSFRSCVVGRC